MASEEYELDPDCDSDCIDEELGDCESDVIVDELTLGVAYDEDDTDIVSVCVDDICVVAEGV